MLTVATLCRIFPRLSVERADMWVPHLNDAMRAYCIDTPERAAAFLAQTGHESLGFLRTVENLYYTTPARLVAVWPSRFKSEAAAAPYTRNPEKLAEKVYGGRADLGNTEPGDGWKYRGRGAIMTTGRANYAEVAQALALPLIDRPEMLELPSAASMSAAYYWSKRGLNRLADRNTGDSFATITRRIAGGLTGHAERARLWAVAKQALGAE